MLVFLKQYFLVIKHWNCLVQNMENMEQGFLHLCTIDVLGQLILYGQVGEWCMVGCSVGELAFTHYMPIAS